MKKSNCNKILPLVCTGAVGCNYAEKTETGLDCKFSGLLEVSTHYSNGHYSKITLVTCTNRKAQAQYLFPVDV